MTNTAWQYYKDLKAGGVPEEQAVAETDALNMAVQGLDTKIEQVKDELKADIKDVKAEIKALRTELKSDIKEVKSDIKEVKRNTNKIFYTIISAMIVFILKTVVMACIHGR